MAVVIVTAKDCRVCNDNKDFFVKLEDKLKRRGISCKVYKMEKMVPVVNADLPRLKSYPTIFFEKRVGKYKKYKGELRCSRVLTWLESYLEKSIAKMKTKDIDVSKPEFSNEIKYVCDGDVCRLVEVPSSAKSGMTSKKSLPIIREDKTSSISGPRLL